MWLFALFVAVPILEIALFIQVGGFIGLVPTLLIVVATALLGTHLVRKQGREALSDLQNSFSTLNDPTKPLAHGAMILFSGALLLTPGFFTDAVGFALLIPAVRDFVIKSIKNRVQVHNFEMGSTNRGFERDSTRTDSNTIDGEWSEIDIKENEKPGNSGWTRH